MNNEQSIKDAAQLYADCWNAHDASRFNELFVEDADFCTYQGTYIAGREMIQKVHQFIFDKPFHQTSIRHEKIMLQVRNEDLAVYRSEWELVGTNPDVPFETRTGMFIFVMQKN